MLTREEQYTRMDAIIRAVCEVGEFTYPELLSKKKSLRRNALRGVAYLLARDFLVHPRIVASMMRCSRQNVINVARNYHRYMQSQDEVTVRYYVLVSLKLREYGLKLRNPRCALPE